MIYLFTYLLIYGPPLLCGFLYYRKRKKKLAETGNSTPVQLYLVPFIVFTIISLLRSGLLYGIAYLATQG